MSRATTDPNVNRREEQHHQSVRGVSCPQSLMQDIRLDFEGNGEMLGHRIEEYEHPLMMNALPSLPGIDDHQRPAFHLAELHENLRQMRQVCITSMREKNAAISSFYQLEDGQGLRRIVSTLPTADRRPPTVAQVDVEDTVGAKG